MEPDLLQTLSQVRFHHAQDCLNDAKTLLDNNSYKGAANRAYYAIFHGMRAVLALDHIDKKHHSGIISEFRRRYIKTAVFPVEFSRIISVLEGTRTDSDYDDFFIISKEEVVEQIADAEVFLVGIKEYLLAANVISSDMD